MTKQARAVLEAGARQALAALFRRYPALENITAEVLFELSDERIEKLEEAQAALRRDLQPVPQPFLIEPATDDVDRLEIN